MKTTKLMTLAGAAAVAVAFARADEPLSDDAMKERIVRFVTLPSRMCGHALVDFREEFRSRKLTNRSWFDGDTNRLARLIAELAQTNDMEMSSQMIESLGEYGTPAQLPFLYSCATNPASWAMDATPTIGDRAMKAALRIEGVTSNSVDLLRQYLLAPRQKPFVDWDRCNVCKYFVSLANAVPLSSEGTNSVMGCLLQYAPLNNVCPKELDGVLTSFDPSYGCSRRRLAVFRAVNNLGVDEFEINYVTNAINELVAYPEANLPD